MKKTVIEKHTLVEEYLMMRLRLMEGMPLNDFEEHVGYPLLKMVPKKRLEDLEKEGLLTLGEKLTLTFEGMKKLNSLLAFLT